MNYNGSHWLAPLYDSLFCQNCPRLKIYLVDNASSDESVAITLAKYPEVRVIKMSMNAGFCVAYNRAMPIAFADGCEWVIWANNDMLLEPGCLREMATIANSDKAIGVIGPAFLAWDSNEPNYYMKGKHPAAIEPMENHSPVPVDVDWVEGSFLMVSKRCVEDVGWLDPYLFFYWEEADFCRRALRKGWRVVLATRALARHYSGGSFSGNSQNASAANFLKTRNGHIYVLADPNRSFARNLVASVHSFLVVLKASLRQSYAAAGFEIRSYVRLIPELGRVRNKWRRDRSGLGPEMATADYEGLTVEIKGGSSNMEPVKI